MLNIDPKEIKGPWDGGYVLDRHTISSTMIGYNEFGHPEFDTQRSELGELVYRLKYKRDKSVIESIVETTAQFLKTVGIYPNVIVPMPPSKQRPAQPMFEIGSALSGALNIPLDTKSVSKLRSTAQMKDIGDFSERAAALKGAFTIGDDLVGKEVLLIDDLLQSGASMMVVAELIKVQGRAKALYVLALTRTRS
jgi:competence protein ComFC